MTGCLLVRESPPRQVDKKSGVLEVEEKGVWGSQGKNAEVACHSLFQWEHTAIETHALLVECKVVRLL